MPIEEKRPMAFHCPLGADVLLVRRLSGHEQLGRPFQYDVELLSEQINIKLESLLGQNACVRLEAAPGALRYFSGVVADFALVGSLGRYHRYTGVLRPWFWHLTRSQNCRVFQRMKVKDIILQIFGEHGFSDYQDRLHGKYSSREYCVQYRESDFNFISRLMEEEGITYYFTHELEKHTLVLADDHSSYDLTAGFEEVPFQAIASDDPEAIGQFFDWQVRRQLQPGKYVVRDYDFEKPSVDLSASSVHPNEHALAEGEIYDYPGGHKELADGERQARTRLEELNAQYEVTRGTTNVRGLGAGALFKLIGHTRADQNREYLLTSARYHVDGGAFESGDDTGVAFSASLTSMDAKVPFRPERVTARPRVPGPQTAVVVGPSGSEIWTDPEGYGRVKVQFPWDREGKKDADSSCWVRVSQAWAGLGWGSMHLPHVGDEVVVSFLEGDPDRPLITGRVYNANNMPWQPLPAKQTTSYFRDVGGNHLSMTEGTNIEMYTPEGKTVFDMGNAPGGNGFFLKTDLDYTREVKGTENVKITGDSTWNIYSNSFVYIDANFSTTVGVNLTTEVKANETKKVWGALVEHIMGPVDIKLGSISAKFTAGAASDVFLGYKHSSMFGVETVFSRSKKYEETKDSVKAKAGQLYRITVGKTELELDGQNIKVAAGATKITISKDGGVVITAKGQVAVSSKSTIKLVADSSVMVKAPKVAASSGIFESKNIKDLG